MRTLAEAILEQAAKDPEREAIRVLPGDQSITFGEWCSWSASIAAGLPERKSPTDYVLFRVEEPSELPIALLAAWSRGLALFPVSPELTRDEREQLVSQAGEPVHVWERLPERGRGPALGLTPPPPEAQALFLHTSGSTAEPKVYLFRHAKLLAAAQVELANEAAPAPRSVLNLRPAFTSGGTNTLWPAFLDGRTLCYASGKLQQPHREAFQQLIETFTPELVVASPAYLRALLASYHGELPKLPSFRLYYGGTRLRTEEHRALWQIGAHTTMRYGMTECAHLLSVREIGKAELEEDPGIVGKPFGEVGTVEGETLSFRAPGFASARLVNGRPQPCPNQQGLYVTDDKGHRTTDGLLWIEGRDHRQIVVSGHRVSAEEVENTLLLSGQIVDCFVFGVPDPLFGERVAALVQPDAVEYSEAELLAHAAHSLSPHKRPFRVRAVPEIPATLSGKRDARRARALFAAGPKNLWESHFEFWKKIRKEGEWKNLPEMKWLIDTYKHCLKEKIPEELLAEIEERLSGDRHQRGKHVRYQLLWNWNALAFQYYKFHNNAEHSRNMLRRALELTPLLLPPYSYGSQTRPVEAVWLIFLLNDARLDLRGGKREQGRTKLSCLRDFLEGEELNLRCFDEETREIIEKGEYRFSHHEDLVSFLQNKMNEEELLWLN